MKIIQSIRTAVAITAFATGIAFAQDTPKGDSAKKTTDTSATTSTSLHEVMQKGAQKMQAMQMSGDVDHDFLTSMRDHHMHGIEMANVVIAQGKDPKVKAMAKKIIDAQQKEIKELEALIAKHKPSDMAGSKGDAHKH